jgi:hypothetical protein
MSDWKREEIVRVFAGTDCVMAVTADGRTLQKCRRQERQARLGYWTRIRQIALSKAVEGLALGLVADGTCLISKRPLRALCEDRPGAFERINGSVKSWQNIVQVVVSDAFFALDGLGRVHCACLDQESMEDYRAVSTWQNVRRIVTGIQNSVFGITGAGQVLCAGGNCSHGPRGDMSRLLAGVRDVVDLYPTGSECEEVVLAQRDGRLRMLSAGTKSSGAYSLETAGTRKLLDGHFNYHVYALTREETLICCQEPEAGPVFDPCFAIRSFAVGDAGYGEPFLVAVGEVR